MSDASVDLRVEDVWKQYRLSTRRGAGKFWALQHVDFEVRRGASLGVIGRNGAGKSTLLKLLAGITAPTRGRLVIHGKLAALIEVGSGFHPELTGRENVFLSGAVLGMRRREIAAKLDRIVEFAGVAVFIDTPVKWYSSGMHVRLGFAVAAHLEADILLVDEVLAVGDAEFQAKCLRRIQELKDGGTTSVFISHDLTTIERLCDSAVLLEAGTIVATGAPSEVVAAYHQRLALWDPSSGQTSIDSPKSGVALTNLTVRHPEEPQAVSFRTGAPLTVTVRYAAARAISNVEFELRYYAADGKTRLAAPRTGERNEPIEVRPPGGVIEFSCAALPLTSGSYSIGAVVRDLTTSRILAWWDGDTRLYVESGAATDAQFYIPHTWRITHNEAGRVSGEVSARE
jgi:ABC-type polysaccharide/polyol phosphate transport system ATPase subunit